MSDRGIYGIITDGVKTLGNCLIIGHAVPRVHHTDSLPVYLVVEHPAGLPVAIANGTKTPDIKPLLAYPSSWPGPGGCTKKWIYAYREPRTWNALIPCFDDPSEPLVNDPGLPPETITEACDRLHLPLPPKC